MSKRLCTIRNNRYVYLSSGKALTPDDRKKVVEVLTVYKIPQHLSNVIIIIQTLNSANKGLVFKGQDSKERWQYFYGKNYIADRSTSRLDIIKLVHESWDELLENIDLLLSHNPGTLELQLGLSLYLITRLFIRIGKRIHYRNNNTQGVITLKPNNISYTKDSVRLKFIGKDNVNHDFSLLLPKSILMKFKQQDQWIRNNKLQFLFSYKQKSSNELVVLKEYIIYDFLERYSIKPKYIRTYGANIIFMSTFMKRFRSLMETPMTLKVYKNIVTECIEETAEIIGHTKNVSKSSYIAIQVLQSLNALYDEIYVKNNSKVKQYLLKAKDPYKIIEYLLKLSSH